MSIALNSRTSAVHLQIGVNTTGVLGQQREQLVNTSKQLDNIEDELRRADLIVRAFMRRMATDKVVSVGATA